jgi:hypothetical protein
MQQAAHCHLAAAVPAVSAVLAAALPFASLLLLLQVKFKLGKINAKDDSIRGLHRLLFNRDGTVRRTLRTVHHVNESCTALL